MIAKHTIEKYLKIGICQIFSTFILTETEFMYNSLLYLKYQPVPEPYDPTG